MFLHECTMTRAMLVKWQGYREDTRLTLEAAFHDAVTSPWKVRFHSSRIVRTLSKKYEMHAFIVGYVSFRLATPLMPGSGFRNILIDASLHDGLPLYSRGFIRQSRRSAQVARAVDS